jgi:NTE family protein
MPTAFVLAGGASLGAIEAGMLQALYEHGKKADRFVGTSAGALNAGFAATHPQTVDAALELQRAWRDTGRRDAFPFSPLTSLKAGLGLSNHLFPNRGLRRIVERRLDGLDRLEDAGTTLGVVVTDLLAGKDQLLVNGPALPALLASAAIPAVYPPVEIEGRPYVDGGVTDNTPISKAVKLGADTIYVLPTGLSTTLAEPPKRVLQMAVDAFNLLLHARLHHDICAFRDKVHLIVLPPPEPIMVMPTDFEHADELIEGGYRQADEALHDADPAGSPTDKAIRRLRRES